MSVYDSNGVAVIVPAYNEAIGLGPALDSLLAQSVMPRVIVVVVNNSTDDTLGVATRYTKDHPDANIMVLNMPVNPHKKAGALNKGLSHLMDKGVFSSRFTYIVTMDGDTVLDHEFLQNSRRIMRRKSTLGGLSASCLGKKGLGVSKWQKLLALFQEVEYTRYRFLRVKRNVHTMSGAGSFYRVSALQQLIAERGSVFREDAANLVEDFETTLALKELGWAVTSNGHCIAHTDLMLTRKELRDQRQRWVRGTVDELRRRGWNKHTRGSIVMLILGLLSIPLMAAWLGFSGYKLSQHLEPQWEWVLWTGFWSLYQAAAVRALGWKVMLFEAILIPEIVFGALRNYWLLKSVVMSYITPVPEWKN